MARLVGKINFFNAAAQKYKSLSLKLYHNVEDLKELVRHEKHIRMEEVGRVLLQFQTNRQTLTKTTDDQIKRQRNMEFNRAITYMETTSPRKNLVGGLTPTPRVGRSNGGKSFTNYDVSRIDEMNEESEDPIKTAKELEEEEDRILKELLNTKVRKD